MSFNIDSQSSEVIKKIIPENTVNSLWDKITNDQSNELSQVNTLKKHKVEKLVEQSGIKTKEIPLSIEQKNKTVTQLENSNLSGEEKNTAKKIIKEGNFDFLHSEGIDWWILSTFLSILSVIFSVEWKNDSYTDNMDNITDDLKEFEQIPTLTKLEFAKEAKKHAKRIDAKYWIPWEISLAQTILESGWWQSEKAREYGVYFGVKWKGKKLMSTEDYWNWIVKEASEFRTYNDLWEAFEWYANFLMENPRYSKAFKYTTDIYDNWNKPKWYIGRDPIRFLQEIKNAGYATDSNYVGKIANVMHSVEKRNV